MSTILLDTTVLIDALRGRPAAQQIRKLLADGMTLLTTAINVEEIVRGLRPDESHVADALLSALIVLPIGRAEAEQAGRWRQEYAARGSTLHQADCLIAAAAHRAGAAFFTGNPKDFPMPAVSVTEWPVGR